MSRRRAVRLPRALDPRTPYTRTPPPGVVATPRPERRRLGVRRTDDPSEGRGDPVWTQMARAVRSAVADNRKPKEFVLNTAACVLLRREQSKIDSEASDKFMGIPIRVEKNRQASASVVLRCEGDVR